MSDERARVLKSSESLVRAILASGPNISTTRWPKVFVEEVCAVISNLDLPMLL